MNTLLDIKDLSVSLASKRGQIPVLNRVNLSVAPGQVVGLVGESGSGKSMTAFAITQLLPGGRPSIAGGEVIFKGEDLTLKTEKELAALRGKEISMIFQEPMTCLNPVFSIARQMTDVISTHRKTTKKEALERAEEMLAMVHIREPKKVLACYPYELSGGMRQRVMIAMALSCSPTLLIADEPTTALDVTIQAQIIYLIKEACKESDTGVIFISHDLGVISQICDSISVMYAGQIVESGVASEVLTNPKHPYTKALMASIPKFDDAAAGHTLNTIQGMVPDPTEVIQGCRFAPRCDFAMDICLHTEPTAKMVLAEHVCYCHLAEGGAN